jgi:hypothetical protein
VSRHEIENQFGKWVFGWDQPLQTFFLQLYKKDIPEEDNPIIWLGATAQTVMYDVDDLVKKARVSGLDIPYGMRVTLYGDKDEGR